MPPKKLILQHWAPLMDDAPEDVNVCWACGFHSGTERCHIQAKCDGGSEDVSNLLLLCRLCHITQETICMDAERRTQFVESVLDGAPFMVARLLEFKHILAPYNEQSFKR